MAADNGPLRVIRETAEEAFRKVPKRLDFTNDSITESESLDATEADIGLGLGCEHLKGELVLTLEEEHLKVLNFGVRKKDGVVTHKMFGLVRGDEHIKRSVRRL